MREGLSESVVWKQTPNHLKPLGLRVLVVSVERKGERIRQV